VKGSLRNRIIVWSFVPTAIILLSVALVSLYAYQRVAENLVVERDRELTHLSARLLATELAAYSDPLADQYLAIFDGFIVFGASGTIVASEPEEYARWRPGWFNDIVRSEAYLASEPRFSNIIVDGLQGEKMIVVVLPAASQDGSPAGGMAGLFHLDPTTSNPLFATLEELRQSETSAIYLVDGTGSVIYHSDPVHMGGDFSAQPVVPTVLAGGVGALRTRDLEGRETLASFAPVPGTSWGLVREENWAALTSTSRRYRDFSFLLLGLGVVAPTLIVAVGVRRLTQPITDLISAAQNVARGNFDQTITASGGGELEELADQFNSMAAQLHGSYTHLETQVVVRTKELATLNAIAVEASHSLDLDEVLDYALDKVLELMSLEKGEAFRLERDTSTLILMAHRGLSEELIRHTARQPLVVSAAGLAAEEGRPVVRHVADFPAGTLRDLVQREGIELVVSTPLTVKGETVGILNLGCPALRDVTPEELSLLTAIGHQIGVAVENAHLYRQAQKLAVVEERNRLARDLHDSVTQTLYGTSLCAEAAARQLSLGNVDMAVGHLQEIQASTQETLREMRRLIFELRPAILTSGGLEAALRARLEAVEERVGLVTELSGPGNGRLNPDVEAALYRVAQEALNNTLQHAHARRVTVSLEHADGHVTMEIVDDGAGFDPEAAQEGGGLGLCGMQERVARLGGTFALHSRPGEGTRIKVEVSQS
jgi:signal transduction histidine kinase